MYLKALLFAEYTVKIIMCYGKIDTAISMKCSSSWKDGLKSHAHNLMALAALLFQFPHS